MSAYTFILHTKKHNTEKPSDPDKHATYKVTLTTTKNTSNRIGQENAELTLIIKAESDQALYDFPRHGTFRLVLKQIDPNDEDTNDHTRPTTITDYNPSSPEKNPEDETAEIRLEEGVVR